MAFDDFFSETLEDMINTNFEIYKKIVDDPAFGQLFREVMFRKLASDLDPEGGKILWDPDFMRHFEFRDRN